MPEVPFEEIMDHIKFHEWLEGERTEDELIDYSARASRQLAQWSRRVAAANERIQKMRQGAVCPYCTDERQCEDRSHEGGHYGQHDKRPSKQMP